MKGLIIRVVRDLVVVGRDMDVKDLVVTNLAASDLVIESLVKNSL